MTPNPQPEAVVEARHRDITRRCALWTTFRAETEGAQRIATAEAEAVRSSESIRHAEKEILLKEITDHAQTKSSLRASRWLVEKRDAELQGILDEAIVPGPWVQLVKRTMALQESDYPDDQPDGRGYK
jgi:hypothetical protein